MIRYTRGTKVIVETIFYDTSGDIAYPTSANITIAYPDGSTGARWPFDGEDMLTTTIALTTPSTASTDANVGKWKTTWDSSPSAQGTVYWSAVPSNLTYGVNEGQFVLRGGLANPIAVPTTL